MDYWQERLLQVKAAQMESDERYIQKMSKQYRDLAKSIKKELSFWIKKFAENDNLTKEEAYKLLSKPEQRRWQMTLAEFMEKAKEGGYDQVLNREYYRGRITRTDLLLRQLYFQFAQMAHEQDIQLEKYLKDSLDEMHSRTVYELSDKGTIDVKYAAYNERELELAVKGIWNESNFSRRLWKKHIVDMPKRLQKTLSQAVVNGWSVDRTVNEMMDGVDRKMRNYMTTLVQTESAHLSEMAMDKAIQDFGGDAWEWCATLEIHTCEHCGELDGQVFYYKNDKTNPNIPLHPNCRCTKIPVDDLPILNQWYRDPITGKSKWLQNNAKRITFDDWKKQHVTEEALKLKRIRDNRSKDLSEFKKYQSIIGKYAPKSFTEFVEMKYNDSESYDSLKKEFIFFDNLNGKAWTNVFKEKVIDFHETFKENGEFLSLHAASRLNRLSSDKHGSIDIQDVVDLSKTKPNYVQKDGKLVHYDKDAQLVIVRNNITNDIVSIVRRKNKKDDWHEI